MASVAVPNLLVRQLPKEAKTFLFNLFKISDGEKVDKTALIHFFTFTFTNLQ